MINSISFNDEKMVATLNEKIIESENIFKEWMDIADKNVINIEEQKAKMLCTLCDSPALNDPLQSPVINLAHRLIMTKIFCNQIMGEIARASINQKIDGARKMVVEKQARAQTKEERNKYRDIIKLVNDSAKYLTNLIPTVPISDYEIMTMIYIYIDHKLTEMTSDYLSEKYSQIRSTITNAVPIQYDLNKLTKGSVLRQLFDNRNVKSA